MANLSTNTMCLGGKKPRRIFEVNEDKIAIRGLANDLEVLQYMDYRALCDIVNKVG